MGVFEMVVAVVLISAVAKVAQTWARRPAGSPEDRERVRALEAELRANEARLALTEERVAELSEKLGFVEELLAAPDRQAQLPPPPR